MLMLSHKRHKTESAKVILLSSTTDSIYLSSLVAVALEAGFASNVVGLQAYLLSSKRNAFSNKAFNTTEINTEVKVLGLAKTLMVFMKTNLH
jgi:electron transfer flavoprotein alpha subunit